MVCLSRPPHEEHARCWVRALCCHLLPQLHAAELCRIHAAEAMCTMVSQRLSHAPSRQRFKLKQRAPMVWLSRPPHEEHARCWVRALCCHLLPQLHAAELCRMHAAEAMCTTASQRLSHAPSRQRFKLKRRAPMVCLSRPPHEEHARCWVRALCCHLLPQLHAAELCRIHAAEAMCTTASQRLSHAPSRQRFKLKRSVQMAASRSRHTRSMLGVGCVHYVATSCHSCMPLSFAGSTQLRPCAPRPASGSATPHLVSASN